MRVTVLGCGGSQGVPSATGDWGVCDPSDPRNYRRRVSVLVETDNASGEQKTLLIDTSPDLREQLLRASVSRIDALLLTHAHADHIHGLDDLRPFYFKTRSPIPVYAEAYTIRDVERRFAYAVLQEPGAIYRPILTPKVIRDQFEAEGVPVIAIEQDHGFGAKSTGFRIGNFAYSIDVVALSEESLAKLEGITHWVVDCQQIEPHPTHAYLAKTLEWIDRIKPERAILSHMGSRLDYRTLSRMLPPGVEPGVDGLVFTL
jgi:phosphoribosyl 1,2-cyclic phosphate phosphodiesterase